MAVRKLQRPPRTSKQLKKLRIMESNDAARAMFDTLLENCIFYISRMYEFLHSQAPIATELWHRSETSLRAVARRQSSWVISKLRSSALVVFAPSTLVRPVHSHSRVRLRTWRRFRVQLQLFVNPCPIPAVFVLTVRSMLFERKHAERVECFTTRSYG